MRMPMNMIEGGWPEADLYKQDKDIWDDYKEKFNL